MVGVDVIMSAVAVDRAIVGVRDDQSGGGSKKDGGEVSPLEAVGDLYAMDGKIKQMSFVTDKHYEDLDVYLYDLRAKLTSTFVYLLDNKHDINFWASVHVRYTHATKELGNSDRIVLHSGPNMVIIPVLLDRQVDSIIDTIRDRHIIFKRNLPGLVLDEVLKTELQLAEYIPLGGLKFPQRPTFLAKKQAIINFKNRDNRGF